MRVIFFVCVCVQYILFHLCGLEILGAMLCECLVASSRHVDPTSPQVLRCRKQPEAARVSHLGLSKFPNWKINLVFWGPLLIDYI